MMHGFKKILCVFVSLLCLNPAAMSASITGEGATEKFTDLLNQYEKEFFDNDPETAVLFGRSDAAQDRFKDHSLSALNVWHQKEDHFLLMLHSIDEASLTSTPLHTTYLLLKETLENNESARICKEELWNVNPTFGWHNLASNLAERQSVGTAEARKMALKRWQTFNTVVDDEINNLKEGLKNGYTAPKPAVKRVLAQVRLMRTDNTKNSPFFDFAKRDGDGTFQIEVAALIATVINPALDRYIRYLENEYLPVARTAIGVSSLPSGTQCYAAKIKQQTTLDKTPRDIYALGVKTMQNVQNEIKAIGIKEFGTEDISLIFQKIKGPEYSFNSEQGILNYNLAALERANARIADWFEILPKQQGIIKPYPEHRAITGASGEYFPPAMDGSQPGIFYINTYEPTKHSRSDQESTLFHEMIPGHDFQATLAIEDKSHSSLDKYLWNSGFGEGWALYAERLADEMGLYSDDIERLGMLSNDALRAARLVVDTGIHVMHWTRSEAITYLKQHTAWNENIIEGEVDRYIMMPGQATAYMLGKREILDLRHMAQERLGDAFDIKQFHTQVLKNGAVTLPMLRRQIEDWLAVESEQT